MDPKDRPDLIPLIDLDPDQADDVCDAMANVGLEVFRENLGLEPDRDDFKRGVVRLYVPRTHLRDAREVVRGVLPEYGGPVTPKTLEPTEEDSWSQIVAGLRAEGVGEADDGRGPGAGSGAGARSGGGGGGVAGSPVSAADFEEPGYQPPHPPPVPRLARITWLAWGAMLVGLVMLLVLAASDRTGLGLLIALALFVGGFAGVLSRARRDRFDDDDFGDGAVV